MARAIINSDSQRPFGPSNGGIGSEFGDTWDVAVAKINAMFDEIYTVGTAVLNYAPPLQLSGNTVSIAPAGITNGFLANPSLTLGTTTLQLGNTYSTINGNLTFGGTVNFTGSLEIAGTALSIPVGVTQGGTGQTSFTGNALLYGNGTSGLGQVPVNGGTNKFLTQANGFAPSFNAITNSDLPAPTTSALGGVKAVNPVSHQWLSSIDTTGTPQLSQPAFGDLSGNIAIGQMNGGSGASSSTFWCGNGTWTPISAGVNSVSNGDGSLSISPTTGAVVANLNTAHSNTWSANQTFNAPVTAYSLNGVGYIAPGVNGVVGNGSTDDAAAIQAIVNVYTDIRVAPAQYFLKSPVTINMSSGHYRLRGAGAYFTSFVAAASFAGTPTIRVFGPTGAVLDYEIGGFSVINQTAGAGASYGFYLGANNTSFMGGNTKSRIFDVVSSGFAFNFLVQGVRQVVWDRCATWPNDNSGGATSGEFGWYLLASSSTSFTGDMDFDACENVSSSTGVCVGITDQGFANCTLAGIRFRNHTFENSFVGLSILLSGANSAAEDIWVNPGSQFDGGVSDAAMVLSATASGSRIFDVHVQGTYFSTGDVGGHIKGSVANGGTIQDLIVTANSFENNGGVASIDIRGTGGTAKGIKVSSNHFYGTDNPGGDILYFENVTSLSATDNSAFTPSATAGAFIYFAAACEWITAGYNNSGGAATSSVVNATSPAATHTAINNNI